jgi:hypothetical protein
MDPTNPLAPVPKAADPAALAEEERLWNEVLAGFDQDARHNAYMGHCIRTGLLVHCSKRYGAFADDQARGVDARRIARLHQQRIAKILFFVPDQRRAGDGSSGSKVELVGVFAGVLVVLASFGWASVADRFRLLAFAVGLAALGGLGFYLYLKARAAGEKLERTNRDA